MVRIGAKLKQLWAPRAFFVQCFNELISSSCTALNLLSMQASICLDHDQVLAEVIVPGNLVKAITGGRTTEGDVTHKENLGQSTVQLENMSQKTDNREFTRRPIAIVRFSHNQLSLQAILYP